MVSYSPFAGSGEWLRGNLHTHTHRSDGKYSPDITLARYKEGGYDFLALTDHHVYDRGGEYEGMVLLPGIEYNFADSATGKGWHFVGLNQRQEVRLPSEPTPQGTIDMIREAGGDAIVAHPYWLGLTLQDLYPLRHYTAMEVWNCTCQWIGKALSSVHWDDLLDAGRFTPALAVDDCHRDVDFFQGWIEVYSEERSVSAILEAVRAGRFYSTLGPQILSLCVEGSEVIVECSPVESISFISGQWHGRHVKATDNLLTSARFPLSHANKYIRVECTDSTGKRAWSNAIRLE